MKKLLLAAVAALSFLTSTTSAVAEQLVRCVIDGRVWFQNTPCLTKSLDGPLSSRNASAPSIEGSRADSSRKGGPSANAMQSSVFVLSIDAFEKSVFLKTNNVLRKSHWPLRTGGTNYSFAFADPEGSAERVAVELSSDPAFLTKLGVSFSGRSTESPASFTPRREQFLRSLLSTTHPDIPVDQLIKLISQEQHKYYAGGSDKMPRIQVGNARAFVGTVGAELIVGLDR